MDQTKHDTLRWPWFLPDGKHFIFLATSHTGGDAKQNGIYFGSVDRHENHLVVAADSSAEYASGYLLYHLNTALVAQTFDPQTGALSGSPVPVVNNLRNDLGVWRSIFSVSQNGVLIYQAGGVDSAKSRFVSYDLAGKALAEFDPYDSRTADVRALLGVRNPRLSPDNRRVAFEQGTDIWTLDLERKTKTRITFDQQVAQDPDWSPDGKSLIFLIQVANGGGSAEIRSKAADGSGAEKTLLQNPIDYHLPGWSPDGKYLTFLQGNGEKMVSLWIVPVTGDAKPVAIVQPPSQQSNLASYRVSPDGRWVAYESDESGQFEIYITSFPEGKGKWRVSTNGGAYPAWSGNSKGVFWKNLIGDDFYACPVTPKDSTIEIGTPQRLFHAATPGIGISFDAFSDGKRLLVNHAEEGTTAPLELVTNWLAELKK
jgi:hypothetical protein